MEIVPTTTVLGRKGVVVVAIWVLVAFVAVELS